MPAWTMDSNRECFANNQKQHVCNYRWSLILTNKQSTVLVKHNYTSTVPIKYVICPMASWNDRSNYV